MRSRRIFTPADRRRKGYDGTGPSGYSGTAGAEPLSVRYCELVPISEAPSSRWRKLGKKTRRVNKNAWVPR